MTVVGPKVLKRTGRLIKKNVKKSRVLKQVAFLALMLPLVIPVGAVTAAFKSDSVTTPVETPVFEAPLKLALTDTVVTTEKSQVSIEITESAYQATEKAKAAKKAAQVRTKLVASLKTVAMSQSSTELMTSAGIPQNEWMYVDFIVNHEAGWGGTLTYNRQGSSAYGICQALPGGKMASAGADWQTNTLTQLKWCNGYAVKRYGSWRNAYQFWILHRYW